MDRIDGVYDCVTKTPMGDQASVLTIVTDGDRFNGTNAGPLGSLDIKDGKVDGNRLTWRMEMQLPMPMSFTGEALVENGAIAASIDAGAFGKLTMTGRRRQ